MRNLVISAVSLALVLSLSGCLKTRTQLKEDQPDDAQPTASQPKANPVQDVQPQGQYAMDEVKSEITRLNGRIDDVERAQKDQTASQASNDALKKLDQRVTELETAQANMLEAIKKLQDTSPAADPTELYEKGSQEFAHENWDAAIDSLNQYLKSSKPKNAEEAYWMRAESYYHLEKYKLAIADYSQFPEKYTKSKHMAEALYKIGNSFEALGSPDDAKGFYQLLVDKFPKSPYAKKVKSKLK
jgi:TolA-binding protein